MDAICLNITSGHWACQCNKQRLASVLFVDGVQKAFTLGNQVYAIIFETEGGAACAKDVMGWTNAHV